MAFRLKRRRRVAKQLERIVGAELASAREALTDQGANEDGVHEARKSVKKARAVLRLLRAPLDDDYEEENAQLRAVAHALSSLRDADATLDVLERLHAEHPTAVTPIVVRTVRRGLRGRKRRAHGRAETVVAWARGMLDRAKERIPARIGRVARFPNVRAGVVRGYREAREAMPGFGVDDAASAFHEWRKRIKTLCYQLRLFEKLHRGASARVRTLKRLEGWLGEDHDLALLHAIVRGGGERYGNARNQTLVLGSVVRSQASLRARALKVGRRVFGHGDRDFECAVDEWWRSRRSS